jgi:hypothetical protein
VCLSTPVLTADYLFLHFVLFTVPHGDFSDFGGFFCLAAGVSAIFAPEAVFFNAIELPGGITVKPCFEGLTAPSADVLVVSVDLPGFIRSNLSFSLFPSERRQGFAVCMYMSRCMFARRELGKLLTCPSGHKFYRPVNEKW